MKSFTNSLVSIVTDVYLIFLKLINYAFLRRNLTLTKKLIMNEKTQLLARPIRLSSIISNVFFNKKIGVKNGKFETLRNSETLV